VGRPRLPHRGGGKPAVSGLLLALLGLSVGAALRGAQVARGPVTLLDSAAVVLLLGLCFLHLVPAAFLEAGPWALLSLVFGVVVARRVHQNRGALGWRYSLPLAALAAHAVLDGVTLGRDDSNSLTLAVVAHQLPYGLGLAGAARREGLSSAGLIGLVAGLGLVTTIGFFCSVAIGDLPSVVDGLLGGLVAGFFLHEVAAHGPVEPAKPTFSLAPPTSRSVVVVAGRPSMAPVPLQGFTIRAASEEACGPDCGHDHHHAVVPNSVRWWGAGGVAFGGLALVAFTVAATEVGGALEHVPSTVDTLVHLVLESSPALLLGFVLAGIIPAFIDPARTVWLRGGGPLGSAVRGVAFGLPLPICSCGVVPLYRTLVRRGAPATASLAFLVATPELGLDAVLLSVPILGVPMAVTRVIAAAALAVAVGVVVGNSVPAVTNTVAEPAPAAERPLAERIQSGFRFGLTELVDHSLPWIVVGLLVAAVAEPLLDHGLLLGVPSVLQVPMAALIGVPMVVCASGATPIAAIAAHKGLSAGAALAFLLSGPATNISTFGMLTALHGRAVAIRFGLVVAGLAVVVGWSVDAAGIQIIDGLHDRAHEGFGLGAVCALIIGALGASSLVRQGVRGAMAQLTAA
jgi:uncharacterized membrane protein YraQ (UPF0718 family)